MKKEFTKEEFIKRIYDDNSNFNSPSVSNSFSNQLDIISKDIYNDGKRFFFELLQNADDASSSISNKLDLIIQNEKDKENEELVIFSYNGLPFSQNDVQSICNSGDSTKSSDMNKTGTKGIGFKSVFKHTDYLIIHSGGFSFRFDKNYWTYEKCWQSHWNDLYGNLNEYLENRKKNKKSEPHLRKPWPVIPIWTDISQEPFYNKIKDFNVSIIFKAKTNFGEIKEIFSEILESYTSIIFLRCVNVSIKVLEFGIPIFDVTKELKSDEGLIFVKDKKKNSKFLTCTKTVSLRENKIMDKNKFDEFILNNLDIPLKIRDSKTIEISFAAEIKENRINVIEKQNRLIYSYLPTKVNYNFPFLTNSNFILDAGRINVHEDNFLNKTIIQKILPEYLMEWIAELASNSQYNKYILNLIPNKVTLPEVFKYDFDKNLKNAIFNQEFLPNNKNQLKFVKKSFLDEIKLFPLEKYKNVIQNIFYSNLSIIHNSKYDKDSLILEEIEKERDKDYSISLNDLGIAKINFKTISNYLEHLDKKQNTNDLKSKIFENLKFIKFLFEYYEKLKLEDIKLKEEFINYFSSNPILYDESFTLLKIKDLFFPHNHFNFCDKKRENANQYKVILNRDLVDHLRKEENKIYFDFLVNILGLHHINDDLMIEFLKTKLLNNSKKLAALNIDMNEHFRIFKYLYEKYKIDSDKILNGFTEINSIDKTKGNAVKKLNPILMYDSNNKLITWDNLYLGEVFNDDGCDFKYQNDFPKVSFINDRYAYLEENQIDNIKSFLKEIKIKPTLELISLLPKSITIKNTLNLTNWMFNLYQKGILKNMHFDILQECQFLSHKNELILAKEIFISDLFFDLKIQELFPVENFISDSYHGKIQSNDDLKQRREFYKFCGMKDQFKIFANINEIKTNFNKCNFKNSVSLFNLILKLHYDIHEITLYDLSNLKEFKFYTNDNYNRKVLSELYLNSNYDDQKIPELEYFEDYCIDSIDYLSIEYSKTDYSLDKVLPLLNYGNIIKRKEIIPKLSSNFPKMNDYNKSKTIVKVGFNLFQNHTKFFNNLKNDWETFPFIINNSKLSNFMYSKIYLGDIFEEEDYGFEEIFYDEKFISDHYITDKTILNKYREFFIKIGILDNNILITKFELYHNKDNSEKLIKWLLNHYKKDQQLFKFNTKSNFLSENNEFSNNVYFPDDFEEEFKLQHLLPNYNFIRNSYFLNSDIPKDKLIKFFSQFGVQPQKIIIQNFVQNFFKSPTTTTKFCYIFQRDREEIQIYPIDKKTHFIIFHFLFELFKKNKFILDEFESFFKDIKFLTSKNEFVLGSEIFYSNLIEKEHQVQNFVNTNYISDEYIKDKEDIDKYFEFFKLFNLKSKLDIVLTFSKYLNKENSVQLINYIFEQYYNKNIIFKVENYEFISLVTKKGSYRYASELILSDIFGEDVDFEKCLDHDIFVSEDYFNLEKKDKIIEFMKILGVKSKQYLIKNLKYLETKNSIEYLKIILTKENVWNIVSKNLKEMKIILNQSGKFDYPSNVILSDHFYDKFLIQKCLPKEINFISEKYFKNSKKNEIEIWEKFLLTIGLKKRNSLNDTVHLHLNQTNSVEVLNYILFYAFVNKSISETNKYILKLKFGLKVKTTKNSYKELSSLYFSKIDDVDISEFVDNDIFISNDYNDTKNNRSIFYQLGILHIDHFFDCYDKYLTKENNYQLIRFAFKKANLIEFASKQTNLKVFSSNENYVPIKELYLSDEYSNDFKLEKIINIPNIFISNKYFENQNDLSSWNVFFIHLGISSQNQIIERISKYLNQENAIDITCYLYDIWERENLRINFSDLRFLNKNNKFVSPSLLYLNNYLTDKISFENENDNEKFLNEIYFKLKDEKSRFVNFLIYLGVRDRLVIHEVNIKEFKPLKHIIVNQSEIMKIYIKSEVIKNVNFLNDENKNILFDLNVEIQNLKFTDFIERCIENYEFSFNFWTYLIENFKQSYSSLLLKPQITFQYKERNYSIFISSFIEYLCNNTNILPTSIKRCLSSEKIYSIYKIDNMIESIIDQIPCLNLNFPKEILSIFKLKIEIDFDLILQILSNLSKKNYNQQEIINTVEFCYTKLIKDYDKLRNTQVNIELFSLLDTFEFSKYLFYFNPKSVSFEIHKKIGNLSPLYLPEKLKNQKNLFEFLNAFKVNIIDSTNLDVEYETHGNSFDWLEKLFASMLPYFAKIILKNKEIQKYKNIEEIISLGKRIQFIKVSKLFLKYKGDTFLEPLTYRKNMYNKIAIFCKVKKSGNENSFGKISCASFICREIINVFEIPNEFSFELFSLLLCGEEDISDYMSQKGIN